MIPRYPEPATWDGFKSDGLMMGSGNVTKDEVWLANYSFNFEQESDRGSHTTKDLRSAHKLGLLATPRYAFLAQNERVLRGELATKF